MNDEPKTRKTRRRTCYDKYRAKWLEHRRQRRTDPAVSAATQIIALLALLLGRIPLVPSVALPTPYVPPPPSPEHARRIALARRLRIPSRYVDVACAHGTVPYELLFEHVRRGGRSREDAMTVLRQRAPEACRDWLDHVQDWGVWSELLVCHVRGLDEDTDVKLLQSTLAWLHEFNRDGAPPPPAEAGIDLVPEPDGEPDPGGPGRPKA